MNTIPSNFDPPDLALVHSHSIAEDEARLGMSPEEPGESPGAGQAPLQSNVNPVAVITAAEAEALQLTAAQRTAIVKLTSGHTRMEAASAAGVSRMTLYRWLQHDPAFQAAYNAWQNDLLSTAQGQLLAATRDAVATVVSAIRKGDAALAWKLLQSQGATARQRGGPTDVDELERREDLERRKKELAVRQEENQLDMDDLTTLGGM